MRIAPELYLKRLIVSGFDRVFELGKVFRNESATTKHSPEFTMCESYQAYADLEDLMTMTEELLHTLAVRIHGTPLVKVNDTVLDFTPPFRRVEFMEELDRQTGVCTTPYYYKRVYMKCNREIFVARSASMT